MIHVNQPVSELSIDKSFFGPPNFEFELFLQFFVCLLVKAQLMRPKFICLVGVEECL